MRWPCATPDEFREPFPERLEENPRRFGGYRQTEHPAATYAAMIVYLDHTVRRVMQKLRELGIEENTLVIITYPLPI